ncbi:hypothetical protein BCR33DRAFT_852511 [Rhizoclosmatium globosum]|uniref:FHF complex subunit HOOK-interacting protein C-terminal domain-containing protein n=1 Tax=Rhizoclosmatium globosum TaxID=329046 RepID=A0A1Y2C215_9FUNG|nr:hypothetical protein BCR33DRAFT_852511 [Rhizoclosmatium globosum]|eukprot:ORY41059.1 hypothetical protein BCR33DRAFT_852511 [Rhizoclosmatium globosum]
MAFDFFTSMGSSMLGLGTTAPKGRPSSVLLQPGVLQYKYQRAWDNIVLDCETEANWRRPVDATDIPRNLNIIVDILVKEHATVDGGVDPGGITERFLSDDLLGKLVSFSEADCPQGFRGQVISFVAQLLLVLDPQILVHAAVHRPLLNLIKQGLESQKYAKELLTLELDLAAKLYDYPHLLPLFFSKNENPAVLEVGSAALVTGHDFVLLDHILRYVHADGEEGDLARDASLFLVELAAGDLATYFEVADFPAVAIAGLGSMYSLLPQYVARGIKWEQQFKGRSASNAFRDSGQRLLRRPIEVFKEDGEALIRVLQFIQSVVLRCPDSGITTSILEDFQGTFLDNIVSSGFTSSSDFDGSTVAALFYMTKMAETLKEECLVAIFTQFLLSSDAVDEEEETDEAKKKAFRKSMNRRSVIRPSSALMMSNPLAPMMNRPQSPFVTAQPPTSIPKKDIKLQIRDILLSKLASLSEEVVIATLHLLRTLLQHHPVRTTSLLIERLPHSDASTTSPTLKISAQTHLWLLSRYFALTPADSPDPATTRQIHIRSDPLDQPLQLFSSIMDSFVSGGDSIVSTPGRIMVQGPLGVVPVETSLSRYVSASVAKASQEGGKPLRARADVDLDEILLLGSAGGSKGNEVDRERVRRKRARGQINFADATQHEGEVAGVLGRGSVERGWVLEVCKDASLRKVLDMLGGFFSHSYSVNLALTGLVTNLLASPTPLVYHTLLSADLLLGPRGILSPFSPTPSLYTILLKLRREVSDRRSTHGDGSFEELLLLTREELFGQRRATEVQKLSVTNAGVDLEIEFFKNVVLLEEFVKEVVGVAVGHAVAGGYDLVLYA